MLIWSSGSICTAARRVILFLHIQPLLFGGGVCGFTASRLPDVDQMAWQAARCKEHHVDPDVVAGAGEARAQHFGGRGDAAQPILVDRMVAVRRRSDEHTSELPSLMRISYADFCLTKTKITIM